MTSKHKLWLIPVDGDGPHMEILAEQYGKLEYRCPAWSYMRKRLEVVNLEHVTVLWKGKRAHMFVDEMGHLEGKQRPNSRATAIYLANMATQQGMNEWIYANLDEPLPQVWMAYYEQFGHYIVGPALLWTGDMT